MISISKPFRIKIVKLLLIIVVWIVIGIAKALYDYSVVHSEDAGSPTVFYSFTKDLLGNIRSAVIGSVLVGSILIFFVNERYHDRPVAQNVIRAGISFFATVFFIVLVIEATSAMGFSGEPLFHPRTIAEFRTHLIGDLCHRNGILVWTTIVTITQFALQLSNKFKVSYV